MADLQPFRFEPERVSNPEDVEMFVEMFNEGENIITGNPVVYGPKK